MGKLINFTGFGGEYFRSCEEDGSGAKDDKSFLEDYKSVINSKANEESLVHDYSLSLCVYIYIYIYRIHV